MTASEITGVVDAWAEQYTEMGALPDINYVQLFENRGEIMGCSNPHPHGQIWANQTIPNEPLKEQQAQAVYREKYDSCSLCDHLQIEIQSQARLVMENDHFAVLVPFWGIWPFEVLLCSKNHIRDLSLLDSPARKSLAEILKQLTTRYDNLFKSSFPYSMGFHQSPTDGKAHPEWHLHAHFYPPLLRSASVRKFMVGYEMLAGPQRDMTPEVAAAAIRAQNESHHTVTKID